VLRGLPDMSDRTDEQLRCAWADWVAEMQARDETLYRWQALARADMRTLAVALDWPEGQVVDTITTPEFGQWVERARAQHVHNANDTTLRQAVDELRKVVGAEHSPDESVLRWLGEQYLVLRDTDTAKLRALWQRLIRGPAASTIARVDPELEQQMRQACWPEHEVPLTGLEAPADALSVLRITVVMHKPRPGDELAHVEVHARGFDGKRDLGMDASLRLRGDDPNHEAIGTVVSDEVLDTLRGVSRTWALRAESDWYSANGDKRRPSERAWQAARDEPEARPEASAGEMVDTRMRCSLCAKEWIAWSVLSARLPFECPACRSMSGVPVPPDAT
jgi:hypothetical protein